MAETPRRRRDGALGVVGAVTIGAVTATFVAPAALADDPQFPSWNEVQRAKADRSAAEAESAKLTALIGGLQDTADAAGRTASIAAEAFHRAKLAEDAARARHVSLATRADVAAATARTSRMRAGLLAASVARGAGGDLQLMLDPGDASDFLHRLATVSQLSVQAKSITTKALTDENEARSLGAQADAAAAVLAARASTAQAALDAAQQAVAAATTAVAAEQQHADRLVAQLAELRGTSTRLAAQYAAAVRAEQSEQTAPRATAPPSLATAPPSPAPPASRSPTPSGTPSQVPGGAPTAAAPAEPSPSLSAPSPSAPTASTPISTSAGEPNSAQAASAVAFARDQLGDAYRFGGAGPSGWDCSGLTMQAYASLGIGIGGHSATAQFALARAQGKLVPYSQVRVGDLVFYSDGGGDMYHVAVYSGAGLMIEAPYPGVPVREVPVRSADRVSQVARPTASAS
ncbi:C40 family peptidase [uncultured Amnibacterium sp.]|uniref:C40 family peptidase n=1 Tax=uncultured Amnibacterium sp. TaxID=1631851 RepID=UPI0035CC835D